MNNTLFSTVCAILLMVVSYLSYTAYQAPEADYHDPQFNLKLAEEHLQQIASDVHVIGSQEHKKVREYIARVANEMDYEVQLDTVVDLQSYGNYSMISDIKNIVIRKPGSSPAGTIAFAAHYDSQTNTPGAADDGAPIAAMLSLMQTIKDRTFKNDIVFIITDGEESGLSGASMFVKNNPLAPKLNYLFNFEARGNSGPVLGFEPNEKNNQVMDIFLDLDYSLASSLMYDVYRLMPNDTDFTHFKKLQIGGISMAHIDGFVNYHAMTDTPKNMDSRSFYHHGKLISQLIDKMGNDDLQGTHDYNMTYFNTYGYNSVQYKPYWNIVMWILSLIIFGFYIPLIYKDKSAVRILTGIFISMGLLIAAILTTFLMCKAIVWLYPHYSAFYSNNFYNAGQYFVGFLALVTLVFQYFGLRQKGMEGRIASIHLGGMIFLLLAGGASLVFIPSGSYFIIVPVFFFLLIQQAKRLVKEEGKIFVEAASLVIPVILFSPMIYLFYAVFSLEIPMIPMATYSLLMIMGLPFLASGTRLWSIMLLCMLSLSLIRGEMSSKITTSQPYQANWTYYNTERTGEEKIVLRKGLVTKVEKDYFTEITKSEDGLLSVPYSLAEASPIEYVIDRDTSKTTSITDRLRIKSDKDVIRIRIWGELLAEANIKIRGEKVKLGATGSLRFLGNIKDEPLEIEIERALGSASGSFILETTQRGLIDKIRKDRTIIPGVGYTGGTIIHRLDIDI